MKSNQKHSAEFENFDNTVRQVLSVSKEELHKRIEAQKQANAGKPKRGPKPKQASHE